MIDQPGEFARTTFGFGEECDEFYHIVAVRILVLLRLSFVYILGLGSCPDLIVVGAKVVSS